MTHASSVPMSMPNMVDMLDIGCEPDFVVSSSGEIHRRAVPPRIKAAPVRECSGHIHISLPQPYLDSPELAAQFVTELDGVVYPLSMDSGPDLSSSWYRQPRVYRPTAYGVEYRSLGAGTLMGPQASIILGLVFDVVNNVWSTYK